MFVSRDPLVQSVVLFAFLLVYTFSVVKLQPMSNKNLNRMEIASCISIIMGAFASIFFSVEYRGQLLLAGASRNFVGLVFVIVCALCGLSVMHLLYASFSGNSVGIVLPVLWVDSFLLAELLLMHKDISLLSWVVEVKQRLGDSCKNGVIIPLVCMFFNEVSSPLVIQRKQLLMQDLQSIERSAQQQRNCIVRACYSATLWYQRLKLRLQTLADKPPASLVASCVAQPEFYFLQ